MKKDELVRCYAYLSGPILGYLLDKSTNEWRKQVDGNSDLGILVQKAYNIVLSTDKENHIQQRKAYYDYDNIMTFEYYTQHRDKYSSIESYYTEIADFFNNYANSCSAKVDAIFSH